MGVRGEPVRYGATGQATLLYAEMTGVEEIQTRLRTMRRQLVATSNKVGEKVKDIAVREVRKEAPRGRTGKLAQNIYGRVTPAANGFGIEVISGMYYSHWVIAGRGPVYPVHRKALRWVTKGGQVVFAMRAGPAKANPFHERGWRKAEPLIRRAVGEDLTDLVAVLED